MKKLIILLLGILFIFAGCLQNRESPSNIKTKKITINYDIGSVVYYFDIENSICYVKISRAYLFQDLTPVDANTCFYLYNSYIEPNEASNNSFIE